MTSASPIDTLAQLNYRFFYYLDEWRYADLLALMKPDALWHRQGKQLRGHAEIRAALEARPRTQRIRHVITNCFVDASADGSATVKAYMIAYRYDEGTPPPPPPLTIDGPLSMSLLTTRFVREGDGKWLIAEQSGAAEFQFRAVPPAS